MLLSFYCLPMVSVHFFFSYTHYVHISCGFLSPFQRGVVVKRPLEIDIWKYFFFIQNVKSFFVFLIFFQFLNSLKELLRCPCSLVHTLFVVKRMRFTSTLGQILFLLLLSLGALGRLLTLLGSPRLRTQGGRFALPSGCGEYTRWVFISFPLHFLVCLTLQRVFHTVNAKHCQRTVPTPGHSLEELSSYLSLIQEGHKLGLPHCHTLVFLQEELLNEGQNYIMILSEFKVLYDRLRSGSFLFVLLTST